MEGGKLRLCILGRNGRPRGRNRRREPGHLVGAQLRSGKVYRSWYLPSPSSVGSLAYSDRTTRHYGSAQWQDQTPRFPAARR